MVKSNLFKALVVTLALCLLLVLTPAQDRKLLLGAGGPSGTPFSPPDLANLAFWFKADQITGLNDGDALTTWNDQSGNSRNVTQSDSNKRATYKTSILNGLPVVRFDGINDEYITAAEVSWSQYLSIFWVLKYNGASGGVGYDLLAVGSVNIFYHQFNNTTTPGFGGYDTNNNSTGFDQNTMTSGAWNVFSSMRRNGSCEIYVKGATNGSTATSGTANSGNAHLRVGGWGFGFLDGDIAEIVIYAADIGSTDRQRVEDYLGSKYAITITH